MEHLVNRLKELGYELVYYAPEDGWRVIDFLTSINDFLPSAFVRAVFDCGFVFSCGITNEGSGLYIKFKRI